ncbi:hypothetical protein RhiXN_07233 [Rhizoctonia solani]|uniref:Uncharacterized protein n=1 Tax=Rhizoctonia solani TaxID=456999 RepID=A0A8H8T1E5_9AGAM|nr:uncharacterized protein RhiXN_07233 [Rhizoctonia solani]QRW25284.1 hypothetical protein RhiXN_07233 [Rhizoctonia solani]
MMGGQYDSSGGDGGAGNPVVANAKTIIITSKLLNLMLGVRAYAAVKNTVTVRSTRTLRAVQRSFLGRIVNGVHRDDPTFVFWG